MNLTYVERNGRSFEKFVLFTSYKVDLDEECLSISVNLDLKHILNSITADFKNRLNIPKTYQMNDITKRVLKPIINELSSIFNNLNINKIKAKKGRKIECLEFTFDAEKRIHSKRQPQMANIGKSRQYMSREKTPKWLEERTYGQQLQSDFDPQLEKDKEEFLKQLKLDWEE